MRYLLVVGFACEVYRREPRARIFVGDKLIDEFCIKHYKDSLTLAKKNFQEKNHILQPFSTTEFVNMQMKNFPPLRFYEIEEYKTLDQMELRIEIKNSDSNYNNGFMTNSTSLKLQVCFFFPLDRRLLSRLIKIRKKNFINKNYAWYKSDKNTIFELINNGIKWKGENAQMFNSDIIKHWSIGGNGYFYCRLVKKYGIFISKLSKSYRYILFDNIKTSYFINKYKQHENQRNTD